jgi:hypothetical protein
MHHKIDKENKMIIEYDKQDNILSAMKYKIYKDKFNLDLFKILLEHWEYKSSLHNTPQLDFNI